jgi:glycosyltransferase involved in cell wall biosynthesis
VKSYFCTIPNARENLIQCLFMIQNKSIAVVVPAYNEERQIVQVIETMPEFVDRIVVVNDHSTDKTLNTVLALIKDQSEKGIGITSIEKPTVQLDDSPYNQAEKVVKALRVKEEAYYTPIKEYQFENCRIICIDHTENGGVGAAIATGYKWCRDNQIDCTAVMAGDGQMDPSELEKICLPVIKGEVDYVKGNRLLHKAAWAVIPKVRFWGNSVLSILTKIASGYWRVSDTQTGYTSISLEALEGIQLYKIYKTYGVPNDILVKLNIGYFKIKEVPIKPVYNVGEKSKMKIWKVIPKISVLLMSSFFKRLFIKYFFRSFHPLFICYIMFLLTSILDVLLLYRLIYDLLYNHNVNENYLIVTVFTSMLTIQFLLFGMWFDMQDNDRLHLE